MQKENANEHNIELQYELNINEENEVIISDQGRMMQVLLGLQSNAIKYTTQGHVKHIINLEKDEKQQVFL